MGRIAEIEIKKGLMVIGSSSIVVAMCANVCFFMTYFAERSETRYVERKDDVIIAYSDGNCLSANYAFKSKFTGDNAEQRVDETIAFFKDKWKPFSWWIFPTDEPSNLGEILKSKGFKFKQSYAGMFLDLDNDKLKALEKFKCEELRIEKVLTLEKLKDFSKVLGEAKFLDMDDWVEAFKGLSEKDLQPEAFPKDALIEFYVGYVDDKPVTTGVLILHSGVANGDFLSAVPEYRGKGYAAAIMKFGIQRAKDFGCKTAVLQSEEECEGLYKKLGAVEIPNCELGEYIYEGT